MALSINGFGTRYYGKKWQPDGTYITTKYVVFLWIPIVRVGELRVQPIYPQELPSPFGRARILTTLKDLTIGLVGIGLLLWGLPALLGWLHPS